MTKFLKKPASAGENKTAIDAQPGRDHQALLMPLSIIKLKNNIRLDEADVDELAESIKQHGLLQPLVVRKDNGSFTLIAGHRRYQALLMIGAKEAPVRIQNVDENHAQVLRLIENIQRQDLSGAEEVLAVANLLPIFDGNQSALGRAIGKSPAYVSRCITVSKVIEANLCDVAKVSKSILFELAASPNPKEALAHLSQEGKLTVQNVRKREGRKLSGAVPGGRYVSGAVQLRQHADGIGFNLRVNFSPDNTPDESRQQIIRTLAELLKKLQGSTDS